MDTSNGPTLSPINFSLRHNFPRIPVIPSGADWVAFSFLIHAILLVQRFDPQNPLVRDIRFPPNVPTTFAMNLSRNRTNIYLYDSIKWINFNHKPSRPGTFITSALIERQWCLYCLGIYRFNYPYIHLMVRDYTDATDVNGGRFMLLTTHVDSNWIDTYYMPTKLRLEYYWYFLLFWVVTKWKLLLSRISKTFENALDWFGDNVEDNIA